MNRTRIKICGVCREEDAIAAADAGADAIGMIFHPGAPREVSLEQAARIIASLPAMVTPVGLFVNASTERVQSTARTLGLRHVQLHGDETAVDVDALSEFVVLKALRVERATFSSDLARWREVMAGPSLQHLKGFVLDSPKSEKHASQAGGTGSANDWETVFAANRGGAFDGLPAMIAAGGLTPQNVGRVVRELRPYAVDVSSGVERVKREKDPTLIRAFVDAVREADAELTTDDNSR